MLVHRIPYPPNKGDKIRSYHLLRHLAAHYRVHLATFVDDAEDWQHVPRLQALCASSCFTRLEPRIARLRSLRALFANRSLSLDYYRHAGMQSWVNTVMQQESISRVLVFSSAMAQYTHAFPHVHAVVDFVDVDSDKWRQYALQKSWPMNWLYRHEARQLLRYEREVARHCAAALFVSQPESELFRQLAPESAQRIGYFNNGVDTDYFSPEHLFTNPYPAGQPTLVFTGAMDYWPNIDAVTWFVTHVFALLRERHPGLHFYIVGARPPATVHALAQQPGVVVTGTVDDVRPFIAHAAISVAPLRVARGIQNKVLEAMAMAKPVVVSPQALEGITAVAGSELVLAQDAPEFVARIAELLAHARPAMGGAARLRVQRSYSWASNLAQLGTWLESTPAGHPAPARLVTPPLPVTLP